MSDRPRPPKATLADGARLATSTARGWLAQPSTSRTAARIAVPLLVALGLLLPPISLVTRLTAFGYAHVPMGRDVAVASDPPGAVLEIRRRAVSAPSRVRLSRRDELPRGVADLPPGRVPVGGVYDLDFRGPVPREAWLLLPIGVRSDEQAFVDPFAWDGESWRWLTAQHPTAGRARLNLPLADFAPRHTVMTKVEGGSTELSAVLLPPPAVVPAAVAELPILELRAYWLNRDDGTLAGRAFPVPAREARTYGVIHNREGTRWRTDLVNNILILPETRQRHRVAIVNAVRRDGLDGLVLDYRGVADDLQPVYAQWLGRLAQDIHRAGAELVVTVPMPKRTLSGWDSAPWSWPAVGEMVDGVRVNLPEGEPMGVEALDDMVRWALQLVDRRKLQISVPVQGRDAVDGTVTPIGYGEALSRILDMAQSDAPDRITPGSTTEIELPTIRAAELGRDRASGMWRFYLWDANRRQHTIWLNDAPGLRPAFDIAARYHLGRIALDGVTAGLDPGLWRMAMDFYTRRRVVAPLEDYQLRWQLTDATGQVLQEASQPLDESSFTLRAPTTEGDYRLSVSLVTLGNVVAVPGEARSVRVAPPPPPAPTPTIVAYVLEPTPAPVVTAPAPADERAVRATRVPVKADTTTVPDLERPGNASVTWAEAVMRSAPDTTADKLTDLKLGDRLDVSGRSQDGKWFFARLPSTGMVGWIYGELVELEDDTPLPVMDAAGQPVGASGTPTPSPTVPGS